jgi:tRNA(fMet)-specific endonuclease VapC
MRYMLDTNICIYLIKSQPPQVLHRLARQSQGSVVMSVVTYAELRAGLEIQSSSRAHDEQVLALLTQRIPVLPFAENDARHYGVLRAAVRDRSRHAMDRLIAAQAIGAGVVLVTNNTADFTDYPGLQLENWVVTG